MKHTPRTILSLLKKNRGNCGQTAKELGIHRSTVLRWKRRSYSHGGYRINGISRKSTRPKNIAYILTSEEKEQILTLRKKRGITAIKIKYILKLKVSVNTIHRFLKRSGCVREYGYHRRPRFQDTTHMHAKNVHAVGYLQMDVKVVTPELSGLPWTCFEYAVIDIYSRWKDAVILNQLDIERSFRTDEEEFYFRIEKRPKHYDELRDLYREYLHYYNHERIHLGIGLKTPAEMVADVVGD